MKKVFLSIVVIGLLLGTYFLVSQPQSGDELGSVTIKVIDQNGLEVINDTISFDSEMSLFELINNEYSIGCANTSYQVDLTCDHSFINGHVVLSIETVSTDWFGSYLKIVIDDIDITGNIYELLYPQPAD